MKSFACSLLALAAGVAIAGQLASAHMMRVERLGNQATYPTGYSIGANFSGSVANLKQGVAATYRIPIEKLHVFWQGNSQPDSFELARFADWVNSDGQPYLVIDGNLIRVVTPEGNDKYFVVEDTDTIADLKRQMERREGYPTEVQQLMRDEVELQDGLRVASLLSGDGYDPKLKLIARQQIAIERLGDKAKQATNYIFGSTFSGTVGELKQRVAAAYQVPSDKVHVFWMGNSQPDSLYLDIFASPKNYGRQPTLAIDAHLINIVKPDGTSRVVGVDGSDKIADLKRKICKSDHIPIEAQRLMRDGRELGNSEQIDGLISGEETVFELAIGRSLQIPVERLGNHATHATGYRFDETFKGTVGELKERVAAAYQVPIEKVRVLWLGNSLPDSSNLDRFASTTSYDRQPTLVLDANLVKIIKPDGSSRVVGAEATDTIADLKKKIDRLEDIPAIVQSLMRGDQELQDSEQVASLLSEGNQQTVFRLVVAARQD